MIEFTWNGKAMVVFLRDLPYVAIPLALASLLIPLVAWRLRKQDRISAATQRKCEITWLTTLTIGAVAVWVICGLDYCRRHAEGREAPWVYGYVLLIVLASLIVPAIGCWRQGECLTGKLLCRSLLMSAFRIAGFYVCVFVAFVIVLILALPAKSSSAPDSPLLGLYLPSWFGFATLAMAVSLHLSLPWLLLAIAGIGFQVSRQVQEDQAAEQALLARLKIDSEPLIVLAVQKVRDKLARTTAPADAKSAIALTDVEGVQLVGPRNWMVQGNLHTAESEGVKQTAKWIVYIEAALGNLRATSVTLDSHQE